jgi:N utilization substance protein A
MDLQKFKTGISQLAEEKGIPEEKVKEIIETAMAAAYKKDYGKKSQKIEAELDFKTGKLKFWRVKQVVDKDMILSEEEIKAGAEPVEDKVRFNEERHILLEEAKKIDPKIKVGDELRIPLESKEDYGRIAAQTAKQVILQKLKESERENLFEEYKAKEGEIISGTVQRVGTRDVFFDIGKILGILTREEQIPNEFYKIGQRFKLYVLRVEESAKGPMVFLSRAFPKFISKLFELEVPEIAAGQVEIKAIAREPGSRTKVAVASKNKEIDPIGSAIGQRGTRVMAIISELGGEKIDIVQYSDNPEEYIANSLSPAKVLEVKTMPKNTALCIVPKDQLSLAIGKDGQNVRLAAKLTGWKIDVQAPEGSDTEEVEKQEKTKKEKPEKKKRLDQKDKEKDNENKD